MMDPVVRTLSEFALFADLDIKDLHQVAASVREHHYEPNQIILLRGDPCQGVYLIVRGVVSVRRLSVEGREYVLDYLGPGNCFDLVSALDGRGSLATMEALAATTLYLISCDRFNLIVREYNQVAVATLKQMATQVRYLSDAVEDLALHTVRTRLARFLLSRADSDLPYLRRWTQEEIAAHIGTVRDVVGRTLRSFTREGLLRRDHGRVVIADRVRLEREAQQEEN